MSSTPSCPDHGLSCGCGAGAVADAVRTANTEAGSRAG